MSAETDQAGKRVIRIVDYDPAWPARFAEIGAELRRALGDVALRIDHIGSTSVPGLAAKAPYCREVIQRADTWAQLTGWEPGPSDV